MLTGGGSNLVVDCTGVPEVMTMAPDMTVRGGVVVLVGLPKTPPVLDAGKMVLYERSVVASLGYIHDLPRVARMIESGGLDAKGLITRKVSLVDALAVFEELAADPGDEIKILVDPVGS